MTEWDLSLHAIRGIPLVKPGDNIGQIVYQCAEVDGFCFQDNDVLIIAHKIVSKAEKAVVKLADIEPSDQAKELAVKTGRDPRLCQIYLNESSEIVGTDGRMVITWHKLGFRDTSAGVDRSNIAPYSEDVVSILPKDPDASARGIQSKLKELSGKDLAVIISDTFGNPTRQGSFGVAIGVAGIAPIEIREGKDLFGNPGGAAITTVDALASAAYTIMGQNEGLPVVVVRGARFTKDENASIRNLLYRGI
ncbi:coenzyme F420-0:L-glutamate ligase [Chloroflexota bacterium]